MTVVRKRLEQNYQKYFWDLCEVGDANKDGNIDLEEWLDVMNDIIGHVKQNNSFPEWYEGLHKLIFRANEFMDERNISKPEFADMINMMLTWEGNIEAGKFELIDIILNVFSNFNIFYIIKPRKHMIL